MFKVCKDILEQSRRKGALIDWYATVFEGPKRERDDEKLREAKAKLDRLADAHGWK